jgi:hypothetical protein
MTARLLIQFIAQIFLREIRVKIRNSPELQKLSKTQIMYAIKAITKITFKDKNNKIAPELSKTQREIIEALGLSDTRLYT